MFFYAAKPNIRQTVAREQLFAASSTPFCFISLPATIRRRRAFAPSDRPRAASTAANMPSILSDDDKDTVKRFVPKQSNKIQAVAVAKLYVAYPNRAKWTYTGLQGAIVLANDLVGNTYWLKLVDISVRVALSLLYCWS